MHYKNLQQHTINLWIEEEDLILLITEEEDIITICKKYLSAKVIG